MTADLEITSPAYKGHDKDQRLTEDVFAVIEARDREDILVEALSKLPYAQTMSNPDRMFEEEYKKTWTDTIAYTLKPPRQKQNQKRLRTNEGTRDWTKAVRRMRRIFATDKQWGDELEARLTRHQGGWGKRRRFYDTIIFEILQELASYIRAELDECGIARWANMPTPEGIAIDYYLKVQADADVKGPTLLMEWWGCRNLDDLRERLLEEMRKFKKQSRRGK